MGRINAAAKQRSHSEITILELARQVIALPRSASKLETHPPAADDPAQRKPDITLARQTLRWEPKVPLEEGPQKTIEYFQGGDVMAIASGPR